MISYSGLSARTDSRIEPGNILCASVGSLLRLMEKLGFPAAILVGSSSIPIGNDLFHNLFGDRLDKSSGKSRHEMTQQLLYAARSQGARNFAPFKHEESCFVLQTAKLWLSSGNREEEVELIRIHRLERTNPLPNYCIRELYGLTKREAELALEIASGVSVADYARSRSLSEGTVRIQLKSIFCKTETHSQTQLCALLRPSNLFAS